MTEHRSHRRDRKARRRWLSRQGGRRRGRAMVGKAAITAALTLGAARHGHADGTARKGTSAIEAALPSIGAPAGPPAPLRPSIGAPRRKRRTTPFEQHIVAAAARHGVSEDLVRAIIQVESGFDHRARSPKGARGLMQLMPATGREMGARNLFDPEQNIFAGVRYLRFLLDAFDGDVTLATAAYNAGPAVVRRYGGVPPYEETRDYVERVRALLGLRPWKLAVPAFLDAAAAPADASPLLRADEGKRS